MKRNEICCDVCGKTVARKDDTWFARYEIINSYIKVPYHYLGGHNAIPSKKQYHICSICLLRLTWEIVVEKKEKKQ